MSGAFDVSSSDTDASTTSEEPSANSLESSTVVLPPSMSSTSPPATGEDFLVATLDAGRLGVSDTAITIDTRHDSELERCFCAEPIGRSSVLVTKTLLPTSKQGLLYFHERGPNFADGF